MSLCPIAIAGIDSKSNPQQLYTIHVGLGHSTAGGPYIAPYSIFRSKRQPHTLAYGSTMSTTRMCVVPDANAIEAAAAALGHLQGRWGGHSPQGPTCTSFGRLDLSQTPASTDALFPTLHPEFTSWKCPCQCDRLHSPHMPQLSSAATMRDLVGL